MFKNEEEKREWYRKYRHDNEIRFNLAFKKGRDDDLITFWMAQENKQAFMRELIRQEMERQNSHLTR